jgi:CheY-like chemotaxis protein
VLLCEDNYLNTEIAKILLEEQGVQVSCAENGKTGVELFKKSGIGFYSAVLMDIRMPVMDGYDATRTIRGLNRPDATLVPIIAMTADAFEEDIRNCREAGMVGHVTKPIDSKKLLKLLRETIAAYKTP